MMTIQERSRSPGVPPASGPGCLAALERADVERAVAAVCDGFASEGWCIELLGVDDRNVVVRLAGGACGGVVPWVLRRLEHELRALLPGMRGVILVS